MSKLKTASFEDPKAKAFGDILSEREKRGKVKAGLLGCGYFEYWRMYPALEKKVSEDLRRIHKKMSVHFETFYPGMVDTLDAAEAAGVKFAKADIDVIIVAEGTYLPDFIVLQALDKIRHIPVLFFNTQTGCDVSPVGRLSSDHAQQRPNRPDAVERDFQEDRAQVRCRGR